MEELQIKGKKYISSKRAAKLTGYAKDYIGQLARGEKVAATRVGRAWYVSESEILAHAGIVDTLTQGNSSSAHEEPALRSLNGLQGSSSEGSSRLKTWEEVAYFNDDYSLLPEKIKTIDPKSLVKDVIAENIAIPAKEILSTSNGGERKVTISRKVVKEQMPGLSMDGVAHTPLHTAPKVTVLEKSPIQTVSSKKERKEKVSHFPVVSSLVLAGSTAGFLILILSGNVVPAEWSSGGNVSSLAANVSSTPLTAEFMVYLRGLLNAAVLLFSNFLSVLMSMFGQFVSAGVEFIVELF